MYVYMYIYVRIYTVYLITAEGFKCVINVIFTVSITIYPDIALRTHRYVRNLLMALSFDVINSSSLAYIIQ